MKLSELHAQATPQEWKTLAEKAGADPAYLWQLATRWRGRRPSVALLARLVEADSRLTYQDLMSEFAPDVEAA